MPTAGPRNYQGYRLGIKQRWVPMGACHFLVLPGSKSHYFFTLPFLHMQNPHFDMMMNMMMMMMMASPRRVAGGFNKVTHGHAYHSA